jgi:hypothetical protein
MMPKIFFVVMKPGFECSLKSYFYSSFLAALQAKGGLGQGTYARKNA